MLKRSAYMCAYFAALQQQIAGMRAFNVKQK